MHGHLSRQNVFLSVFLSIIIVIIAILMLNRVLSAPYDMEESTEGKVGLQNSKPGNVANTTIPHAHHITTPLISNELELPIGPTGTLALVSWKSSLRFLHTRHEHADGMTSAHRIPRVLEDVGESFVLAGRDGTHTCSVDVGDGLVDPGRGGVVAEGEIDDIGYGGIGVDRVLCGRGLWGECPGV